MGPAVGAELPPGFKLDAPSAAGGLPPGFKLDEPAKPADAAPKRGGGTSSMSDDLGFVAGNLNKGIAGLLGLPVDTARNAGNLMIAGLGMGANAFGKPAGELMQPMQPGIGSGQWFGQQMQRGVPSGFNRDMSIARTPPLISSAAEPESKAGEYGAAALQMLPGAAMGRPTNVPMALRTAGGALTSGMTGQAAADVGGEEWRGIGAMAPAARQVQHAPAGERATAGRQAEAFGKAKDMGIPVPPRAMKPDKPQQKLQDTANKDLRQPQGTELSPENFKNYTRAQYEQGYTPLESAPELAKGLVPNKAFQETIKKMRAEQAPPPGQLPKTFKGNKEVLDLLADYQQGTTMQPKVALRAIRKLREDSSSNFTSEKPEKVALAKTQKGIANALEQLIDDNLAATKNQQLLGNYRQARTMIAKAHDYMDALQPGNTLSGGAMAQSAVGGKPLSGGAKDIAQVAGAFPGAIRSPADEGGMFAKRMSPFGMTHPGSVIAHALSRMSDPLTLTRPYQAMFVDPRNRLSPEQQRAMRYMMAAQGANQQGIPPVPQ